LTSKKKTTKRRTKKEHKEKGIISRFWDEVTNPLSAIVAYSEILLMEEPYRCDKRALKIIRIIRDSAISIEKIIGKYKKIKNKVK